MNIISIEREKMVLEALSYHFEPLSKGRALSWIFGSSWYSHCLKCVLMFLDVEIHWSSSCLLCFKGSLQMDSSLQSLMNFLLPWVTESCSKTCFCMSLMFRMSYNPLLWHMKWFTLNPEFDEQKMFQKKSQIKINFSVLCTS